MVADDAVEGAREPRHVVLHSVGNFIEVGEGGAGEDDVGDLVFAPVFLDNRVKIVVFIIHRNSGLIPVHNDIFGFVECQHVAHSHQIGFDITDHDFHLVANTVVHLEDSTRSAVLHKLLGSRVMEPDLIGVVAPKRQGDLFTTANGVLSQSSANVARSAHKDHTVFFG